MLRMKQSGAFSLLSIIRAWDGHWTFDVPKKQLNCTLQRSSKQPIFLQGVVLLP